MSSEVKTDKLSQRGSSGIVISDDIKLSSGKAIKNASGTALLGEDGALGSGVTGAGSWVKLESQTVDSSDSSVIIGWNSVTAATRFVSTYKIYKIIMSDMVVSDNDTSMRSQAYAGSSGTPATPTLYSSSHYTNVYYNQPTNDSTLMLDGFSSQAYWSALAGGRSASGGLLDDYPSATTDSVHNYSEITLYNPSGTSNLKCGRAIAIYFDSSNEVYNKSESGFILESTSSRVALSAFSIYPESGTFIDGTFDLYGIA